MGHDTPAEPRPGYYFLVIKDLAAALQFLIFAATTCNIVGTSDLAWRHLGARERLSLAAWPTIISLAAVAGAALPVALWAKAQKSRLACAITAPSQWPTSSPSAPRERRRRHTPHHVHRRPCPMRRRLRRATHLRPPSRHHHRPPGRLHGRPPILPSAALPLLTLVLVVT